MTSSRALRHGGVWVLAGLMAACSGARRRAAPGPAEEATETTSSEWAAVKSLLDSGDADGALQRIAASSSADSPAGLYWQGEAWSKKAETAPLPTPEALPPGSPRGAVPVTPEFKPEELKALDFYERAAAAAPKDARPQLGIARLLGPHAQRKRAAMAAAAAAAAKKPVHGHRETPPPPSTGPDFSPARVLKAYRAAVEAKPKDTAIAESMYSFAVATDQLDDADWLLKQAIEGDKENPDRLVRYGDFLADVRKMPDAAVAEYQQALLWRPDDKAVKGKIAQIYLDAGLAHAQQKEWVLAEASYRDALKYSEPRSEQFQRIQTEIGNLRQRASE